jgi:hypothetical protein
MDETLLRRLVFLLEPTRRLKLVLSIGGAPGGGTNRTSFLRLFTTVPRQDLKDHLSG